MYKLLLFLLLVPFALAAQPVLKVSREALFTYSKYDDAFFVLDDSSQYYTYKPKEARWQKHALHMVLSDDYTFAELKGRFHPLAVGKGHYLLVQDGCGMVYELKHDTLKRIDHSFDQKNQFGSALYSYNQRVYMFGGYGLFEVKNTHSYFDIATKEWYQVKRNSYDCPPKRSTPYFIQQNAALYVMGGVEKYFNKNKIYNDIWHYNPANKTWKRLGELNPDFVQRTHIRGFVQNKDYKIFTFGDKLTIVDVVNNKYYSYVSGRYFTIHRLVPDANLNYILVATHITNDGRVSYLKVKQKADIIYGSPSEYYLYKPISLFKQVSNETYLWFSVLLNLFFFFLLFYIRRITKTAWYKPKNPVLERKEFTDVEWAVLKLIKETQELELSALNSYFDEPGLSYETLKKRRESFVKALRIKLALLTRRNVESLLPESKHPLDKRMKVIRWNNELEIKSE
ncbi:MAG: kelch repeat-containing protein [Sphingomonadales bacterium]